MTIEQEKEQLKFYLLEYIESITGKSKNQSQYICPLCGSGTHSGNKSTGAFTYYADTKTWYCFKCGKHGDIFTLIGEVEGLSSFPEQLQKARDLYGGLTSSEKTSSEGKNRQKKTAPKEKEATADFQEKCRKYIKKCREEVNKTEYYHNRGFTDEIIDLFNLGYDEKNKNCILPYGGNDFYYITRNTEKKIYRKPPADKAGSEPLFHEEFLYSEKPCFVTEGVFDAISIMQAISESEEKDICNAIALCGVGAEKLISLYDTPDPPKAPLIICLDNDSAGNDSGEKLYNRLKEKGIACIKAEFNYEEYEAPEGGEIKDPNNLLLADKELFKAEILNNILALEEDKIKSTEAEETEKEIYNEASGAYRVLNFFADLKRDTEAISTGFINFDNILDGGLYAGLYTIGAISSMGKTTFVLQLMDQIAKAGKDVIFLSLEMSASELIAKSLSRLTYEITLEEGLSKNVPKTVRGIMCLNRYRGYSKEECDTIYAAQLKYGDYAGHIFFKEGIGDIGIPEIRSMIETHRKMTGNTPIICIDYLQILAPYDVRATDKQNTDTAVRELKRLSRDFGIPIIAISSLNRENYSNSISMSAFKESGAIEYGSDVLIGLQPLIPPPEFDDKGKKKPVDYTALVNATKAAEIRKMELVILKQRNGLTNVKAEFEYNPMFNYFREISEFEDVSEEDKDDPFKGLSEQEIF